MLAPDWKKPQHKGTFNIWNTITSDTQGGVMDTQVLSHAKEYSRRNFLSMVGRGVGLATLTSATVASLLDDLHAATKRVAHLTPQQAAMDEDFWFDIRRSFTVTRGITNLNNGGVSPSPRIVTEAFVHYTWEH